MYKQNSENKIPKEYIIVLGHIEKQLKTKIEQLEKSFLEIKKQILSSRLGPRR